MSTLGTRSTVIVAALYDDAGRAAGAAAAVEELSRGRVSCVGPDRVDLEVIEATRLPTRDIERYLEELRRGRALVLVETESSHATSIDLVLRDHRPLETAIHAPDPSAPPADHDLPAAVQSTAALSGRPRGHRDPSA